MNLPEATKERIRGQRLAQNSPHAQTHGLQRQFGGDGMHPQHNPRLGGYVVKPAEHRESDVRGEVDQQHVRPMPFELVAQPVDAGTPGKHLETLPTGQEPGEALRKYRLIGREQHGCHVEEITINMSGNSNQKVLVPVQGQYCHTCAGATQNL